MQAWWHRVLTSLVLLISNLILQAQVDIWHLCNNRKSPHLLVIWFSGKQREREKPLLTWSNTVALAHRHRQYTVYNTIHSYCPQEESCVGHTTHWLLSTLCLFWKMCVVTAAIQLPLYVTFHIQSVAFTITYVLVHGTNIWRLFQWVGLFYFPVYMVNPLSGPFSLPSFSPLFPSLFLLLSFTFCSFFLNLLCSWLKYWDFSTRVHSHTYTQTHTIAVNQNAHK